MAAYDRTRPATLAVVLFLAGLSACAPPADRPSGARDRAPAQGMEAPPVPTLSETVDLVVTAPTPPPLDISGTLASFWWHHEVGTDLVLSDAQVAAMDDEARSYLEGWNPALLARREGPGRIAAALANGDVEGAERAADSYTDALSYVEAGHQRLKIAVFSLLDGSQQRTLASRYPQLLRDRWVVGRRLGRQPFPRPR